MRKKLNNKQQSKQALNGQVFKSGLSGTGEMETKYHTATHLLLATLQKQLSADIIHRGSNNTAERLRFDFNFPRKLTAEEIQTLRVKIANMVARDKTINRKCCICGKENAEILFTKSG